MIQDNYDMWEQHEREQEAELAERLVCEYCGNPIQEDYYYEILAYIICKDCLNFHFRKDC